MTNCHATITILTEETESIILPISTFILQNVQCVQFLKTCVCLFGSHVILRFAFALSD